jgi:hypothetical protein
VDQSTAPRGPDGRPDLQGIWDFRTVTPLERPGEFGGQDVLTAAQAAELETQALERQVDRPPSAGSVGGYNRCWFHTRSSAVDDRRTSLIVWRLRHAGLDAAVNGRVNVVGSATVYS